MGFWHIGIEGFVFVKASTCMGVATPAHHGLTATGLERGIRCGHDFSVWIFGMSDEISMATITRHARYRGGPVCETMATAALVFDLRLKGFVGAFTIALCVPPFVRGSVKREW